MKRTIKTLLAVGFFGTVASAQIEQTHPELCGLPDGAVPHLPAMSIVVDQTQGSAQLFLGEGMTTQGIDLPGVIDSVPEVCPLPSGQYLIFGETYNATNMVIVDLRKRVVVDAFDGFEPAMSPDQRWIAYKKFYPRVHDLPISEEYLLYSLSKTPSQNRAPGISATNSTDVGQAIFPVGRINAEWDNYDLPDDRMHGSGSRWFYWSADSRLVVFGDVLQDRFAVIAVLVDNSGSTKAYEHPMPISQVCPSKPEPKDFRLMMTRSTLNQEVQGEYVIKADFEAVPGICVPKSVELRFPDDFKPSTAEAPFQHQYKRKPAVVDQ